MRPSRSFLLLLIFLVCFAGLHYISPLPKLFPSVQEFIPDEVLSSFTGMLKTAEPLVRADTLVPHTDTITRPEFSHSPDSISADTTAHPDTTVVIDGEKVFPVIDNPLAGFLESLRSGGRQTRIMYYGDSQIEGDRMSSWIRESLRRKAGGTGPGLFLPVMPVMYTKTIWIRSSPNWKRYNYLSYRNKEISHRNLGPMLAICRYLPEGTVTDGNENAWVRIRPSKSADSLSSVYDQLRLFYRRNEGTVNFTVSVDGKRIFRDTLAGGGMIRELKCTLGHGREVLLEFSGNSSPDIYGISIESDSGLIVDNIPQRGSAGLEFTMVNRRGLADLYNLLSPDLIILQYGLNIVRNVKEDYSYYRKGLSMQLAFLKDISPGTQLVVIGLTDMASRQGDSIESFPNIPLILEAQKDASFEQSAVFWDSYKAMGGKNSIVIWGEKNPPLAQKDMVHLTYPGADTLSRLLIASLFTVPENDTISADTAGMAADTVKADTLIASVPQVVPAPAVKTEDAPFHSIVKSLVKYDINNPFIFSSAAFWLFLLVVLAGYSIIYKKLFIRNFYLFLVSLFFYYKSGGLFLFLLILVIIVDFSCGLAIGSARRKSVRKLFILASILSNLGILAYFKYTGFIINTVNDLLGTDLRAYDFLAAFSNNNLGTAFSIDNIILPVGISFFTFQSLSYTFDVYRRKIKPVRSIIDFGFYVSFFPQLVAGPIVRASEFIPQIYEKYHLDKREFSHAVFLICKGLIKKIIISDFIAVNFIDRVFDAPSVYSGFENLMAVYGYGLQIYCDFSGYTDIAIGIGLLFGFRLPLNFNSPYKAQGVSDFWTRWHISLSRWLRDYLYIPLGGNRKGRIRTYINLMLTMLLGGLWHGADLRFIIWGFLHGVGLVADKLRHSLMGEGKGAMRRFISVFFTFQFISFCWIFFRAPDIESIRIMLSQVAENFSPGSWLTVLEAYSSVFLLIFSGYLIHFLPETVKESYRGVFIRIPLVVQLTVVLLIAVLLFQMRATETMPFIYFRF